MRAGRCTKDVSARGKALEAAPGPGRTAGRALEGDGIGVDEAAVIARVRAGEAEAYAELVRAFTGMALRAAAALGAGADAEDVVQQSFFKAYCALGRFRDGSAFKPWLLSIVANETRNTVRSAARRRSVTVREAALTEPEPLIPESADPAVAALERERRAALLSALDRLGEHHRLVVTYRYLLDMDEEETAQALGWPRGTVKSRLSRALRKLERLLPEGSAEREGGEGRG
ncbi:RNA polymerase sigma factor [Streptomyces spectabilis]|uniref:RNA polymerase sigma factor n=1 Tax=Streptomyces spectabilis TaxID=68270 RepID=A0A516RCC8_STRST|nr:RNA polymerase sigma factor [Streptomyces spectabilis]